ncbi:hypothetical protein RIF25_15145 [Thermosynechococcaceae cyanobacterium BACA0444]|uniref:Uncharacterized protein n=1 Tax=Pseudocalidococcus azoricus BACA0444 TaxID=2918990 RepID=A0AAE4K0Q2_9CYAN|nr:hypothetical protein [Pseudocalidococcus azoricus]MDS3862137.1 hypothetical protein [Pseudocalidococcus azoricus BACA0444]
MTHSTSDGLIAKSSTADWGLEDVVAALSQSPTDQPLTTASRNTSIPYPHGND